MLRVLQERKIRPLGSNHNIDIDVRIISATHRDLPKAMQKKEFREDLLNVIEQCVALTSSPVISDALVEQALSGESSVLLTFVEARNQFELNYLRKLLQMTRGNVTHAARLAGRHRTEFYKLLSRHELDASDFKE